MNPTIKTILYIGNILQSQGGSPTGIETLSENLREEGYTIITASGKKSKFWRLFHMVAEVFRNPRRTDFVLIDTYSTSNFWYAVTVAKVCRLVSLKYIPILRGGDLPKRLETTPRGCKNLFGKAYYNVAPSNYLLKAFNVAGYLNTLYIPNNIILKNYHFKERTVFKPRLLWVRAFAEIYNPLLALQVLELLLKSYPEAELCMVGPSKDGSLEGCKDYAQQKNLPVKFPGKLSKPEWTTLAADYDLFLNTTNIDNTPVSLLEAMALGLPVISTRVGGIPYLLEHQKDALLVSPDNAEEIAAAILRLLENPLEARSLAQSARERAVSFDWQQVRGLWLDLLGRG